LPEPISQSWKLAQLAAKDAESLARLHARCFDKPWSANDFRRFATWPPYFGLTAWRAGEPIGIIVVSMAGTDSDILSFCVDPAFRRHGVASALIRRLLFDIARLGVKRFFSRSGSAMRPRSLFTAAMVSRIAAAGPAITTRPPARRMRWSCG
jgi:GNAT superfamily N-acetyltransferase